MIAEAEAKAKADRLKAKADEAEAKADEAEAAAEAKAKADRRSHSIHCMDHCIVIAASDLDQWSAMIGSLSLSEAEAEIMIEYIGRSMIGLIILPEAEADEIEKADRIYSDLYRRTADRLRERAS